MTVMWAITAVEHPALRGVRDDCEHCLALAPQAVSIARATGSTGARATDQRRRNGDGVLVAEHSATVTRIIAVLPEEG